MTVALLLLLGLVAPSLTDKLPTDSHLKPIGNSGPNHAIEVVDGFVKPAIFVSKYMKEHRPVVMRGAIKNSPAFLKWNDEYFRSKTPKGKDGNVFIEYGKKENRSDPSEDIHFLKFLDVYNTSDMYMVHHVPAFLAPDVVMPFSIQCEAFNQNFADTVMWFSSGGTKSVFHNDAFENINCLYRGQKRLVMANATQYRHLMNRILDVTSGSHSSVDVEKVDLKKYPFFEGMDFHIAEMKAGDCLYIPFQWLHHVSSTGSNLAVNVWMKEIDVDVKACKDKPDNSLTLDKFTYSEKDEGMEEPPPPPAEPKKKKNTSSTSVSKDKESKNSNKPIDPNLLIDNLATHVMGENPTATKETFINRMMEGQTPSDKDSITLNAIFSAIDVNKNGKWDDEDVNTVFSKKKETLLVKIIARWQLKAKRLGFSYDLFTAATSGPATEQETDGEDSNDEDDRMTDPSFDPTIYTNVGEKDEL